MKEIRFKKSTQMGIISGTLRINGKFLFFKYNDTSQSNQAIRAFRDKGVEIEVKTGWMRVNLFNKEEDLYLLGDLEINPKQTTHEEMEIILFNFYKEQYKKSGFYVEVIQ